jgi:Arc/MetJ family transcription regulator
MVKKPLADVNISCIFVCMRTTLNLDEKIFEKASKLTGIKEKTLLLHEGLKTLIERESARRLAMLGGSSPKVQSIPRR